MKFNNHKNWAVILFAVLLGMSAISCKDQPDEFEPTKGVPVVKYVRMTSPSNRDSLVTGAYMESVICIVGENLRSINEIYFNDQKAVLNTSYLTDNTFIVAVPKGIPEVVTDKIYLYNAAKDVVEYDFRVLVPKPTVSSITNEWAKIGEEVTIYGDYFIDDPNVPIQITFPGNVKVTEITSISKTEISFIVPQGATTEGTVAITSIYGTGQSKFHYLETRGMLFDWDGNRGLATGHGWRNGDVVASTDDIEPLDGKFVYFEGEVAPTDWLEDGVSFNYWPEPSAGYPELSDMFDAVDWQNHTLKFEVCVPASANWCNTALQLIFTSNDEVTYATANNNYIAESGARGLWYPWNSAPGGVYTTSGKWTTISIPLTNFVFDRYAGTPTKMLNENSFTGLTFMTYAGPQSDPDTKASIKMGIDNIRVVPNN